MTVEEKKQIGADLRAQIASLMKTAEQLGIPLSEEKEPEKAPDGGPTSKAHLFIKTRINPLRRVRRLEDGAVCLIASRSFDPGLHEAVEEKTPRKPTRIESNFGDQPKEDLLTMTVARLRELPEVEHIEDVPKTKKELVDAILEVRETL